jgi:hypothetical protein
LEVQSTGRPQARPILQGLRSLSSFTFSNHSFFVGILIASYYLKLSMQGETEGAMGEKMLWRFHLLLFRINLWKDWRLSFEGKHNKENIGLGYFKEI